MKTFAEYLTETQEVGIVQELKASLVVVHGLPSVKLFEKVIFESGEQGEVMGLTENGAEILLFDHNTLEIGTRVARTAERVSIQVGEGLLGRKIDPLGRHTLNQPILGELETLAIDTRPPGVFDREAIVAPLESGVTMVDLLVPLAKGQRQLIIGDRKTGKTLFLLQTIVNQARQGVICIYALIGKRQLEIQQLQEYFERQGIQNQTVIVATAASDPAGLIFLNPYVAMTIAEYFRDQGKETIVVFDDLTTHAQFYREITLLARRFPGRSAYPSDIFYTHSRLMERGGNFKTAHGSIPITCFPVVQSILGDLSAYITTNVMSMTDGHIFFDTELFDQGQRPAVNPFLSVTRVGLGVQTPLVKDASRQLTSYLVNYEKVKQYSHFGSEVSQSVRDQIDLGEKIFLLLEQRPDEIIPASIAVYLMGLLWNGQWKDQEAEKVKKEIQNYRTKYIQDAQYRQQVDQFLASISSFSELVERLKNPQATAAQPKQVSAQSDQSIQTTNGGTA